MCISISPGTGRFGLEGDLFEHKQATEDGSIIVGIFRRSQLDRPGKAEAALLNPDALLVWKRRVLTHLTVYDSAKKHGSPKWEPVRRVEAFDDEDPPNRLEDDLVPLCRSEGIFARSCTAPMDVSDHPGWLGIQITFSCVWDWDLYSGIDYA